MLKDNLKKARLNAGLTQKEVAEKLGIAQPNYARYEQGKRTPKIEVLDKISEILNTTSSALKGRDDGLEEIVSTLRAYELSDHDKEAIRDIITAYMEERNSSSLRSEDTKKAND